MDVRTTDCPNCGNTIADPSAGCSCGFSLFDGVEVPPPAIVRETSHQHGHDDAPGADDDDDEVWPFDEVLATVDERLSPEPRPGTNRPAAPARPAPVATGSRPSPAPRTSQVSPAATPAAPLPRTASPATGTRVPAARPRDAMLMGCPSCSVRISRRAPVCPKCGEAPYAPCQICASRILSNSTSCPECGDPTPFQV